MKKIILLLLSLVLLVSTHAQKKLTLKECIDIALQNNQQVKDAVYQSTINKVALQQAQYQRLPTLNINLGQGLNTGKSIDPYSNQFINQTIGYGNYGASMDVTLFNGMQITNAIKRNRAAMQSAGLQTDAAKNIITLSVIRAYLQVISSNEIIKATKLQLNASMEQVALAQKKVDAGVLAEVQLSELNDQAATEELALSTAKNNLELARLDLFLAMNYETDDTVIFIAEEPGGELSVNNVEPKEVYEAALKSLPDVQAIQQQKIAARYDKAVAKSLRYPTLSLTAGSSTAYSSSVNKTQFVPDGTSSSVINTSPDNFVSLNGSDYYLQQKSIVQHGSYKPFTYLSQLNSNINSGVGLNLRIPILNGFQAKTRIANAEAALTRIDAQLTTTKNQLRNAVEHSVQNLKNASQRILLINKQVAALQQTLSSDSVKMAFGTFNTTDYVVAKANYDQAKINFIQSKYEYRLLQVIVQFYQKGRWD